MSLGARLSASGPAFLRATSAPGPNTSRLGLALVAGLLVLFFALRHDTFFTTGNATTIGVSMSAVAIAGVGAAVLLVTGHVDLSIGGMYAFIGMVVAEVATQVANPVVAVAVGLILGLALGAFNGTLVRLLKISPLIVTIGLLAVYGGLAFVVSPDFVFGFSESFIEVGRGQVGSIPYPVIVAGAVMLVGGIVLTRTVLGLRLYAIGGDRRAAERAGIRVDRMVFWAYAVNGMLVGLAATLTTAQLGSGAPTLGAGFEFDVLTAVILGGVAFAGGAGRPLGLLIGVATIGILNAGLIFEGLDHWWQEIARGAILLLALGADQISAARRERKASRGGTAAVVEETDGEDGTEPAAHVPEGAGANGRVTDRGSAGAPTLEADALSKRYGAVQALQSASLTLHEGEVVALLGDNGAGKSTIVKIISGAVQADEGELRLDGTAVSFDDPADARAAGAETVYQDLALCPNLSVVHNLMLGSEPTQRWLGMRFRDDLAAEEEAVRRLAELSIRLPDPSVLVASLSGGQRQAIAVARTLEDHVRVICLDEPTAALGVAQTEQVLELVRSAAARGTSVIMVTHDVASVIKVSDRVVCLRRGQVVFEGPTKDLSELELLQLMAGLEPKGETLAAGRGELVP